MHGGAPSRSKTFSVAYTPSNGCRRRTSAATITGDPRLIERLIANLIDNAIRYNTIPGYIDITTAAADGKPVLSIANTGPVIPPADTDRLLQPFQRNGTERTGHNDGLGLGLSIVSAIVNAHHADLHIHPNPAGGLHVETRFP
jgi:signal transduction histidine kinase